MVHDVPQHRIELFYVAGIQCGLEYRLHCASVLIILAFHCQLLFIISALLEVKGKGPVGTTCGIGHKPHHRVAHQLLRMTCVDLWAGVDINHPI